MQANVKPSSPMLASEQQPLKPPSPMQPKNAPKTPISHPQRRCRFQLRLGLCPQRRQEFQTCGPPGRRGLAGDAHGQQRHHRPPNFARNLSWSFFETPQKRCNSNDANSMFEQVAGELRAKLMGGGGTWPGDQWAANVTNVVNLSQKTTIFNEKAPGLTTFVTTTQKATRKTPWIDDVCNNTHQSTPKTQHARPP